MSERRANKRVHVISYTKVQETSTDKTLGEAVDLSVSGLGLYGPDPLEPNKEIKLDVILPESFKSKRELHFNGRVVWSAVGDHPGFFDSGVELLDATDDDTRLLEDFIETSSIEDRWLDLE